MDWFSVDKEGLAKLLERRGSAFAVLELIQNAWDQDVNEVEITLEPIPNRSYARLIVKDDDPNGFADISHAWTLFAESTKKSDPTKRGRFNLGEKLVLALCEEASIATTTGTVIFDQNGRRRSKKKTERGSVFDGVIKMSRKDLDSVQEVIHSLIPPEGIKTSFGMGGFELKPSILPIRRPVRRFEVTLPTEFSDEDGVLRRTKRRTMVEVFEPSGDEAPSIYEMGIPVVSTGDRWHVNVLQKVPLNMNRDNVTPAYLSLIRAEILNAMHEDLAEEDSDKVWVTDAMSHKDVTPHALSTAIRKRFGDKAVVFDPSDHEANQTAASNGYAVIHGRSLPSNVWDNVKSFGTVKPAGQKFPTMQPYSQGGTPVKVYTEDELTDEMKSVRDYTYRLAKIVGLQVSIKFVAAGFQFGACYGKDSGNNGHLDFNVQSLGFKWFNPDNRGKITNLLVHEFGHHYGGHLDSGYHEALTRMAGQLVEAALTDPSTFEL